MSITHKFNIGGHEGYIIVGLYPNGEPGEIFIKMAKEGSTVSGLMDSFALAVSISLAARRSAEALLREVRAHALRAERLVEQSGYRLCEVDHGLHLPLAAVAFHDRTAAVPVREPAAKTNAGCGGNVKSRAYLKRSSSENRELRIGPIHAADALSSMIDMGDAPSCHVCGSIMVRNGSCYKCMSCGILAAAAKALNRASQQSPLAVESNDEWAFTFALQLRISRATFSYLTLLISMR